MDKGFWNTVILPLFLCISISATVHAEEDPTAPLGWTKSKQQAQKPVRKHYSLPSLQSIFCEEGEKRCYAIMNNEMVAEGETIRGYKVNKITPESVRVTRSDKQWDLGLFPLELKQ